MLRTITGRHGRWALHLVLLGALVGSASASDPRPPAFKLFVEEDGVYRVTFEDLQMVEEELAAGSLGMRVAGEPVAIWVEDGSDGLFGPGDWLEFVGEALRGEASYFSEHSRFNVYVLSFDQPRLARMQAGARAQGRGREARLRTTLHLERDRLLLRLPVRPGVETEELWYWAKLASSSEEPFTQEVELSNLDESPGGTVDLRLHLRGWSKPRRKADPDGMDHRIEVRLNGAPIGEDAWNGTEPHVLEIPSLPVSGFEAGANVLQVHVPRRASGDEGADLIDVVVLNWIELDFPCGARIGTPQARLRIAADSPSQAFRLESGAAEGLVVYGTRGSRWESDGGGRGGRREWWTPLPGESSFVASQRDSWKSPSAIVRDKPSSLASPTNRADYIIVAHPRLIEAVRPLADLHRSRGLAVELVDIEDVYDEFNHGILDPRALRAFLGHAYRSWRKPAPRFVLLVGDASWDTRNPVAIDENYADWTYRPGERQHFVKNSSTPYPTDTHLNHRGLVPTWNHATQQGHSASDNFFVAIDGDDHLPDMAIGRLPVVEPDEVAVIVEKTIRYLSEPEVGPWRRRALFITNETPALQRQSDRLSRHAASRGLAASKVYPASTEASNEHHSDHLLELFDRGQLVVHFLGHGGRYIWRTGPPDLKKNHDLFTLEHLDQLRPTARLPIVLSLTCYSAPFDHPSADSIGEKFLRLADRGAIAVIAASWRNDPSPRWSNALLEELSVAGATVGEALLRAKRQVQNRMFVETYNLLGDPAVTVALPAGSIRLEVEAVPNASLRVTGAVELDDFSGELMLELIGADGETLASIRQVVDTPAFQARLERPGAPVHAVLAYAWSSERAVDAMGRLELVPESDGIGRRRAPRARGRAGREALGPKDP